MSEHNVPHSFRRAKNSNIRLMVIGDGVTEKRYFDWFRSRTEGMRVIPKALGESGGEHIVNICSRICRNERLDLANGDRLAIVTDLDYNYSWSDLEHLIELCRRRGFERYISNPSFEVWLLMHYRDVTPVQSAGAHRGDERDARRQVCQIHWDRDGP